MAWCLRSSPPPAGEPPDRGTLASSVPSSTVSRRFAVLCLLQFRIKAAYRSPLSLSRRLTQPAHIACRAAVSPRFRLTQRFASLDQFQELPSKFFLLGCLVRGGARRTRVLFVREFHSHVYPSELPDVVLHYQSNATYVLADGKKR